MRLNWWWQAEYLIILSAFSYSAAWSSLVLPFVAARLLILKMIARHVNFSMFYFNWLVMKFRKWALPYHDEVRSFDPWFVWSFDASILCHEKSSKLYFFYNLLISFAKLFFCLDFCCVWSRTMWWWDHHINCQETWLSL